MGPSRKLSSDINKKQTVLNLLAATVPIQLRLATLPIATSGEVRKFRLESIGFNFLPSKASSQDEGYLARVRCIEVWCDMSTEFFTEQLTWNPKTVVVII